MARFLPNEDPFTLEDQLKILGNDELLDFWLADRRTLVFVTHSLEEAVFLADRIAIMSEGRVVDEIPVTLTRPRDRFSNAFLGVLRQVRRGSRA